MVTYSLKLQIEKLRRAQFGQRSERAARLLDQLELQLEDLEASATEDELAAEGGGPDHQCRGLHPQAPGAQAVPRAPAARARRRAAAGGLRLLRRHAPVEARRGRHRDAGGRCRVSGR
jgi:hypothetical protein